MKKYTSLRPCHFTKNRKKFKGQHKNTGAAWATSGISWNIRDCLIGMGGWVASPRLPGDINTSCIHLCCSTSTLSQKRFCPRSLSSVYFSYFSTNHTWAFSRYQTNNSTVATRRMHDGWCSAFMKSINHVQTWRQKSHEMFARKWLKSSVAAMTQLFRVSKKLINCSFHLLEMPTKKP